MAENFRSTKSFYNFPCTHRQWRDFDGHCKYVHGYSRSFHFVFEGPVDDRGWVVDFGGLNEVKTWLDHMFDHTFLINEDDPEMDLFVSMNERGVIQLRVLPGVSMEATAKFVFAHVAPIVDSLTEGRARIVSIEVKENDKNSGTYLPDPTYLTD